MPSGKRAKQQRREAANAPRTPPPVRSKGGAGMRGPRQASPRVLAAAGVVVVAIVAIVLGVVLSSGGGGSANGSSSDLPTRVSLSYAKTHGLPDATHVYSMFKGIPQTGMVLGSPNAPVTMIEYIDLQCPYCQQFETQVMPSIVPQYVRTGKLKVEVRPLAFIGPDSVRGRDAMIAAGAQGHAFDFAQLLYDNQQTENTGWLNDAMVRQASISIPGLNARELQADKGASTVSDMAKTFDNDATVANVTQTPTVYVGKTGKTPSVVALRSPTDKATLVAAINAALGK